MFHPPEYGKLIESGLYPELRKWFVVDKIKDADFRTAMSEAYLAFSHAIDQETAARMRRQSRVGVAGATSRAEIKATALVDRRRGDIVLLLGGLLGLYLPADNEAMLKKAMELCNQARERSQGELPSKQGGRRTPRSREGRSQEPLSLGNATYRFP